MTKGALIKFKSYSETVPKFLELLNVQNELRKYDKIILKPYLTGSAEKSTPKEFVEAVLKFCLSYKNPDASVFIAEGAEGYKTSDLFDSLGYTKLAEEYGAGLIDLNNSDTQEINSGNFIKFTTIHYPKILLDAFVISLPKISQDSEIGIIGPLSVMIGAFPSSKYSGLFSKEKNRIRKWPIEYSIHDVLVCKMPNFAVADASAQGFILAGLPLETNKQSAKILGKEWNEISYLRLADERLSLENLSAKELQTPKN